MNKETIEDLYIKTTKRVFTDEFFLSIYGLTKALPKKEHNKVFATQKDIFDMFTDKKVTPGIGLIALTGALMDVVMQSEFYPLIEETKDELDKQVDPNIR